MVYASVVIFSTSGDLCRGTYLPKSGQFIFVWLILLYCSMGLMVCCTCILQKSKANKRRDALSSNLD